MTSPIPRMDRVGQKDAGEQYGREEKLQNTTAQGAMADFHGMQNVANGVLLYVYQNKKN